MSLLGVNSGSNISSSGIMSGGDIWSTGAFSFESPLKDLLDSGEYTLEQLLAEDELLQELRGLHPKLLEFFSSEEAVAQLVQYVISTPPPTTPTTTTAFKTAMTTTKENSNKLEDPEFRSIRFPYMACEVICCEMSCIVDTLVDGYVSVPSSTTTQNDKEENDTAGVGIASGHASSPSKHQIINDSFDCVEVVNKNATNKNNSPTTTVAATATIESPSTPPRETSKTRRIRILDLLFSLLYDNEPGTLDDYRAGYFEKILRVLFKKRPDDLQAYVNCTTTTTTTNSQEEQERYKQQKLKLQQAMLSHLYSHSILQIVQRLLLPHRPHPKKKQEDNAASTTKGLSMNDDNNENENTGAGITASNNANNNSANAALVLLEGNIDDDIDDEDDPQAGEIKSDWSKSPAALEILLDHLMGGEQDKQMNKTAKNKTKKKDEMEEQRRLDLSLNAAEVLITIIQNSMLSSTTMLTLTTSEVMGRLVRAASTLSSEDDDGEKKELEDCYFSPHESFLTSAMSVLESLILQLGGYGAVGTMSLLLETSTSDAANCSTNNNNSNNANDSNNNNNTGDFVAQVVDEDECLLDHAAVIADLTALLDHLPSLLDNLSRLLQHPSCAEWRTVTQFSKDVPQAMLGSSRLRIVRVLESLVLLGDPEVDARLVQSDCLELCLNLFWDFQWCSMLHQSVANLLVHVLEGQNLRVEMQEYFLIRCNLLVRLMDSFVDPATAKNTNTVTTSSTTSNNINAKTSTTAGIPVVARKDAVANADSSTATTPTTADRFPVSEDDVDAALENQQELNVKVGRGVAAGDPTTTTTSTTTRASASALSPPPQSFRYGYMGHVIIICQALVHACSINDDPATSGTAAGAGTTVTTNTSNDGEGSLSSPAQPRQVDNSAGGDQPAGTGNSGTLGNLIASSSSVTRSSSNRCDNESMDFSREPLFLAEMVTCHPLSDKWNEFVATTLASETAIQSTPLGGYNATAVTAGGGLDGMMMQHLPHHRPGLADDADELGLEPPSRMGDVLDMDDNDLEIAASMMAGLAVTARGVHSLVDNAGAVVVDDDAESGNSGDSNRSYNSGETNNSGGGYDFDDPLGRLNGGLGIELGKLTKYNPDKDNPDELIKDVVSGKKNDSDDDDDGSSSSSSSSRSSGHSSSSSSEERNRHESESDVPVIDLFAGNFDFDGPSPSANNEPAQDWSNFANFDDAFSAIPSPQPDVTIQEDDDFRPFEGATLKPSLSGELGPFDEKSGVDSTVADGDRVTILAASDETATENTPQYIESVLMTDAAKISETAAEPSFGTIAESQAEAGNIDVTRLDDVPHVDMNDPVGDFADIVTAPSDELKADFGGKSSAANSEEEEEQKPESVVHEMKQQQESHS